MDGAGSPGEETRSGAGLSIKRALVGGLIWLVLLGIIALGIRQLIRMSPGERVALGAFVLTIVALAVVSARSPRVEHAVQSAFGYYFVATLWLFAFLAPMSLAFVGARLVQEDLPVRLQVAALIVFGGLLALALVFVGSPRLRDRLFTKLRRAGWIAPWAYAANVLMIAAVFFATVTLLLHERALVAFAGRVPVLDVGTISDFYLWHIADAVPLLKVPETLHWQPPLTYEHAGVGWLLLLFKVAVVLPVIAAFRAYWKVLHASPSTSEPADTAATGPST